MKLIARFQYAARSGREVLPSFSLQNAPLAELQSIGG